MPGRYEELRKNYERNKKYAMQGNYSTALAPQDEREFMSWLKTNKIDSNVFDPSSPVTDYDMRGFWKALQSQDPRAVSAVNPNDGMMHYPDVWKTPFHETFSNESQWAAPGAPKWIDNRRLALPSGKIIFDEADR